MQVSFEFKIFITLFIAVFVTTMGAGLIAPLLPVYADELGAGAFQVGLIFGAFSLTRSLFVPYFGSLSDRKGKKPLLVTGLLAYCSISLLYYFSHKVSWLIAIRLGHGLASAMIIPVAHAYVGLLTPRGKEGRMMGLFNISLYGGLSFGPVLGGMIRDFFSIKASFLSMGGLSLIGFLLCLALLPGQDTQEGPSYHRRSKPPSYRELMKNGTIFGLFAFRACLTTSIGIVWAFLPLMASLRLGLSSSAIGLVVTTNVFLAGLFQSPMGYVADRFSKKIMVSAGGLLAAFSLLCIYKASSFEELIIANGLLGLAGGISLPAIMALGVIEGHKTETMGSVMGLLALGHSLGMLAGPLVGGIILDLSSFALAFLSGTAIVLAGTIVFLRSSSE